AWVAGVAALAVATLAPLSVALRVELGYAVGSLVVVAVMLTRLRRGTATPTPPVAVPVSASTPGGVR
ncbi:polysaccharide biosynthesis protein, partial [Verrucosispora sp. SN26_14.1]